ncbi:hypothetical protein JAAARDRAFT_35643 [Jaapia argillacea MUCL 33604]|uniref:Glucose receptor Git3 N-terminal domain-containing protein n=1 Tax=Jaapia argillacea MUCL 33604 TaxID=933084 RepID=A0A067PQF2_9AGAM|nr:hypothetical protein JAAARDRAFT_35643 [Jaapia argillacea MUCL 33604]
MTSKYDANCKELGLTLNPSSQTCMQYLSPHDSVGLTLAVQCAMLSLLAVTALLALGGEFRKSRGTGLRKTLRRRRWRRLIREPVDVYVLSLFIADWIQALGTVLSLRWISEGWVGEGHYCSAQGAIQQLGETPVALSTLAITIHTFVVLWWDVGEHNMLPACAVTGVIWVFVLLYVIIAPGVHPNYIEPTPYWCWIQSAHGHGYLGDQIGGEYGWFWLTLFCSIVCYSVLYRKKGHTSMLWYPAIYSVLILPLSIVRFMKFSNSHYSPPPIATFVVQCIYGLSGLANVLLYTIDRPTLTVVRTDDANGDADTESVAMSDLGVREADPAIQEEGQQIAAAD